jgi:hypothetical protein
MSVNEAAAGDTDRATARAKRPASAVTSGRKFFFEGSNPNSEFSRRFRDLAGHHVADCGGTGALSAAKLSLCRRAAALEVACEALEARMSAGEPVSLDEYGRAASHLRRILETLGIERKCRDALLIDGEVEEVFSPMRARWAAEAAAAAKAAKEGAITE